MGSKSIGGLRFDWNEITFGWTGQEPISKSLVRRRVTADEAIIAAIDALHFELLAGFDLIALAELRRENNLAFALQEQGKLTLDDPVGKYVPGLTRGDEVTIRQILSHTSGYQDYWPEDYLMTPMMKPASK